MTFVNVSEERGVSQRLGRTRKAGGTQTHVCDVVDDDDAVGAAVVGRCDGPEPLLAWGRGRGQGCATPTENPRASGVPAVSHYTSVKGEIRLAPRNDFTDTEDGFKHA